MNIENQKVSIFIEVIVNANIDKVWDCWTLPENVVNWNFASDDWHSPSAENDLTIGGKFSYRMEAKDGSFGFDFWGIYTNIIPKELIEITLGDERKVKVEFSEYENGIKIIESFETEDVNTAELQRNGWQAILNNFKKFTESK